MTTQLEQFRVDLYESFPRRADAVMDLVDALSANSVARSVVELSLNGPFRHEYGSVYTAIGSIFQATGPQRAKEERGVFERDLMRLIAPYLPVPKQRRFWLFGLDVTPAPRRFSDTLADRTFVYAPNSLRGNKPVTIGHQYSALVAFPEKHNERDPAWIVPLSLRRVQSQETATQVGAQQMQTLLEDDTLPFSEELCVDVADSVYSTVAFLGPLSAHDNLVTIARVRGNRTFYRMASPPAEDQRRPGHPTWYGAPFRLQDPTTWGEPDMVATTRVTSRKGRTYTVHLEGWHDLLMTGTQEFAMHQHPFTLIRARVLNEEGNPVFRRPLWLLVIGKRRDELSLEDAFEAYGQRYDLEHFFRFGKQRLLMKAYQTPIVEHEENWWTIVQLTYVQLWLARSLAQSMPRPWERYLPKPETGVASPSTVQRGFGRIIRQIGTPAHVPKPRGYSPGREKGHKRKPRIRHPVIKKAPERPRKAQRTP